MKVEFVAHGLEPTLEVTLPFSRTETFRAIGATGPETRRYLEGRFDAAWIQFQQ